MIQNEKNVIQNEYCVTHPPANVCKRDGLRHGAIVRRDEIPVHGKVELHGRGVRHDVAEEEVAALHCHGEEVGEMGVDDVRLGVQAWGMKTG